MVVGGDCEELSELWRERDPFEDLTRLVVATLREEIAADRGLDLRELLALYVAHELRGHVRSFGERYAVVDPLPDLRPRDLRGRGVLHEVVDRGGAGSAKPRRDVLDSDAHVRSQPCVSDRPARDPHVEQLLRGDVDLRTLSVELVRLLTE